MGTFVIIPDIATLNQGQLYRLMTKAKNTHSNSLDALRGLAALSVIFSHVFLLYYSELHSGQTPAQASTLALNIFNSPFTFFYRGGAAVLLFFLLSGYVLCAACIKKAPHDNRYVSIAASKRYLRLGLPVAAAVFIGYLGIVFNLFPAAPAGINAFLDFPDPSLGFVQMLKSALYGSMLFGDGSFDYVLWTISIEFYGSLLVFALYALIGRNRRFSIAFCAALASFLLFLPRNLSTYSLFFWGAALAHVDFGAVKTRLGRRAAVVSLPVLALGCYLVGFFESSASYQWLQPVTAAIHVFATHANPSILYPALGSLCILIAILIGTGQHKPSRGTGAALLEWIGKLSFSVYLLHPFVLATAGKYIFLEMGKNTHSLLLCLAAVFSGTYFFSYFFYKHVDKPSMKIANRFGKQLVLAQRPS
ncbi:acyltransferase family protein [Allopusillimonas ginsengisoli]|uniref:acyltransferase family protein n=1 Tax=Allopusillimonas ginsengisoli TaxID=453575 RepID=UPI00101F0A35|nr:acyltransferase [Allopusillimonas ginsengisoli]TEA77145.1 acyltransferase [Allopusillimonas ginsengisoli]